MADEVEVLDNPEAGTKNEEAIVEGEEAPKIFGKFKDITEAEKAYKEAERKITQQGQTLSERENRLKDLEEKVNLTKAIEALAAQKQAQQPVNDDYDKFISTIGEEFQSNPTEATKKLVGMTGNWLNEVERKSVKYSDDKVSVLESRLEKIQSALERLDPEYVKDKDVIDKLVAKGMTLKDAKEILSEMSSPDSPIVRSRPPITPSGGSRSSISVPTYKLTAKEKAQWKADGNTDEDIADWEAEQQANYERELLLKRSRNE